MRAALAQPEVGQAAICRIGRNLAVSAALLLAGGAALAAPPPRPSSPHRTAKTVFRPEAVPAPKAAHPASASLAPPAPLASLENGPGNASTAGRRPPAIPVEVVRQPTLLQRLQYSGIRVWSAPVGHARAEAGILPYVSSIAFGPPRPRWVLVRLSW